MRAELRDLVARLGISDRVQFVGVLSHQDVLRRLEAHEWAAVVLTSSATNDAQEGIPVSLMEAMAAGVPVVATDSGGTSELLRGGAGILVPLDDEPSLLDALGRIVGDRVLRNELAEAGRRRIAESFDVDSIARDLRRRFAECAG
jgi:glycosyltransferase involved in cell wall biosynthesis